MRRFSGISKLFPIRWKWFSRSKPFTNRPVRLDWPDQRFSKTAFGVDENTRVFGEASQLVRLQFVLLLLAVMVRLAALCEAPCLFDDPFLAQEVCAFDGAVFIGSSEDPPGF